MMKNNYLYSILGPFGLWALDEIFLFKPDFFFIALGLGLLIITFGVRALMKNQTAKFWPVFILPPALFFLSFSFYSALLISQFWIQVIFILNVWFVFYYLQNIYYYFSFGAPEREEKFRRLLMSGSFLSAFALSASLFALPIFLSWPFAWLLLLFAFVSLALFGQTLILEKKFDSEQRLFWGINVIVLAELAGVLFFLPLNYNILGLLLALIFYFLVLLSDWRTAGKLYYKNLKWPIMIGSIIIIFILLSARWL
jgi:hypothetical protein